MPVCPLTHTWRLEPTGVPRAAAIPLRDPRARSHRSDAGNLLARAACGYRPAFRPWLMSVDLYLSSLVSQSGVVQGTHLIPPRG